MTSFLRSDCSKPVAIWLFVVAAFVLAMVAVGGVTRLTGSGLSITEWRPLTGVIPPLSDGAWQAEFDRYRRIPQYVQVNLGMGLNAFKAIYWWEWSHRLLGRLTGLVFFVPLVWFAARRQLPRRLHLRLTAIFILGGLQGLVGWWMVASGLSERVSVAPERLMVHLGLAFALFGALVWTGLDTWAGGARQTMPRPWGRRAAWLLGLIGLQIMLGALVAGNDAGLVYNDWPLMGGRLIPADYAGASLWETLAHSPGAVQFHHRLVAYLLTGIAVAVGLVAWRTSYLASETRLLALGVALAVLLQAGLGIFTLLAQAPLGLSIAHQVTAALVLTLAVAFAWRARRV